MSEFFANPQPSDITGRAVSGKTFDPGCGVVATELMIDWDRQVDECEAGGVVDYVVGGTQITSSVGGLLLPPGLTFCVKAGASIELHDKLMVVNNRGEWGPWDGTGNCYYVALESCSAGEFAKVRMVGGE